MTVLGDAATPFWLVSDVIFDAGCGWLHSVDKNSFVQIAEELSFEIDKIRPGVNKALMQATRPKNTMISSGRWTFSMTVPRKPRNGS